jgi:hypothetical protein
VSEGPVARYLDEVFDALARTGSAGRRALTEIEDHLETAVQEGLARGLGQTDAELSAVERFGQPQLIASGIRRSNSGLSGLIRPAVTGAWIVGAIVLISIGLSGIVAEFMGRIIGPAFVAGDGPGVTYTAARCAEFVEYFPELSCADAATMHHFGEVVEYRVAAGVLGLLALSIFLVARRVPPLSDAAWSPPPAIVALVLAASFGLAAALLGGAEVMALIGGSRQGTGANLSAALVAGVAFVTSTAWALQTRWRDHRPSLG